MGRRLGVIGHDAAAVIVRDGRVVAAIEEERLNRVKHCNFFPTRAIRYCLEAADADLADLDAIAMDTSEDFLDMWLHQQRSQGAALPSTGARQWIGALFASELGGDVSARLSFCKHHLAHTYAAWYTSGFEEALCVCLDAAGDGPSGLIARCTRDGVRTLQQIPVGQSLGYFYLRMIAILGYRLFDEYKVMGLAPYGDPTVFMPTFRQMYQLLPDGRYALAADAERLRLLSDVGLFELARRKGEPFSQRHKDFAAALQVTLEQIVLHLLAHYQRVTGARSLCLSGGVAHNCSMNGKILSSGLFQRIHVPPAAHDAGNALGAALAAVRERGGVIHSDVMPHVYLGPDIGSSDLIEQQLQAWRPLINYRKVADAPQVAARLIASGSVIAWVQSRSEFGPRALGNRSILADPRPAENKEIINKMVKKREGYRPFAPSVLEERTQEFFELPGGARSAPYMTLVVAVRPPVRHLLGAITHVDGTARIQTVSRDANPRYHELIEAFGRLTGVPIVLNTSFNNNAEPIVDSLDDAVSCFLTTGIHKLLVGDWLVEKVPDPAAHAAFLDLFPAVAPSRKLVKTAGTRPRYSLQSIADDVFGESCIAISPALYSVLLDERADLSVGERCATLATFEDINLDSLSTELFDIWQRRGISLRASSTEYPVTSSTRAQHSGAAPRARGH